MRPRLAPLLVSLASLAAAGCARDEGAWEVHGTLERDRLELVAESNERIVEIQVREGERVGEGAILVRQEAGTMQPRLDQARASVDEAKRRLADLQSGPRQREIDEARAALAGAESALETDTREYERVRSLVERKLLSASSLDQARARRDASRSSREQADARLRLLLEGTRPEQVAQAEAAVARANAALSELETTASRYVVRAPRPGVIEALPYELGPSPSCWPTARRMPVSTCRSLCVPRTSPVRGPVSGSTAWPSRSRGRCGTSRPRRASRPTTRSRRRTARG
jgi:HlyD family secretion protein